MGIDIIAFKNIRKTDEEIERDGRYVVEREGRVRFDRRASDHYEEAHEVLYDTHPGYFDGLDDTVYYEVADTDVAVPVSVAYSTYGDFRRMLADYACDVLGDPATFREVVEFSDCEGTIGPVAATKLLADFEANRDGFAAYAERALGGGDIAGAHVDGAFMTSIYDGYTDALKWAAEENGAIVYA